MLIDPFFAALLAAAPVGGDSSLTFIEPGIAPEGDQPIVVEITADGRLAVVLNRISENLTLYDMGARAIVGAVRVGALPRDLELTADGRLALVADAGSDTLSVVDLRQATVTAVPVGKKPVLVHASADSHFAYVANTGERSLSKVDLETSSVVATAQDVPIGAWLYEGIGLAHYSPFELADGDRIALVVGANLDGGITVVDTALMQTIDSIAAPIARGVVVSPDGMVAGVKYGDDEDALRYMRFDTATLEPLGPDTVFSGFLSEGRHQTAGPSGASFYVDIDTLSRIDIADGSLHPVNAGFNVYDLGVTANGDALVVASVGISIRDPRTLAEQAKLAPGTGFRDIALSPVRSEGVGIVFGEILYHFSLDGAESSIVAATLTGVGLEADWPGAVAVTDDGARAVVANSATMNLSVIDLEHDAVRRHHDVVGTPRKVEWTPDGETIVGLRTVQKEHQLFVLDGASGELQAALPLPETPLQLQLTSNGSLALVLMSELDFLPGGDPFYFVEIDGADSRVVERLAIGNFIGNVHDPDLAISPDDAWALTPSGMTNEVFVLDLERKRVAAVVDVSAAERAAIHPGGTQAAVGSSGGITLLALAGEDTAPIAEIATADKVDVLGYSADGDYLYAGVRSALHVIDTKTHAILETHPGHYLPQHLVVSGDGEHLYVDGIHNEETGTGSTLLVWEIDGADLVLSEELPVGKVTQPVSVANEGTLVFTQGERVGVLRP